MWSVAVTTQTSRCWAASSARCIGSPCVSVVFLRLENISQYLAPSILSQMTKRQQLTLSTRCSLSQCSSHHGSRVQDHASPSPPLEKEKTVSPEVTIRAAAQQPENSQLALFRSAVAVAVWYSSNIGLLLLNKYMLSGFGFRRPVFLTLW
jgi:hypothetical protein